MKKIAQRLTDLVGNTPLLELNNYGKNKNLKARVIVKLEYFNPAGLSLIHISEPTRH